MIQNIGRHIFRNKNLFEKERRFLVLSCARRKGDDDGKNEASKKLDSLLQSIIQDKLIATPEEKSQIEIPRPRLKHRQKVVESKKAKPPQTLGEKIVKAAENVAKTVDGPPKQTEAELLKKLLYKDSPLGKEIITAASTSSLGDILSGMEVEKTKKKERKPLQDVEVYKRRPDQIPQQQRLKSDETYRLFGGKRLGIFDGAQEAEQVSLDTWNKCLEKELKMSVTHPPSNIYEQMILWTERGMLWKFPIDNEQGLDEEKSVSFADHVLLEGYLDGWCPPSGPVRHFMELVCVGLSRNYWLSAKEKKDHIMWYRDFFISKSSIIKEAGAGEIAAEPPRLE